MYITVSSRQTTEGVLYITVASRQTTEGVLLITVASRQTSRQERGKEHISISSVCPKQQIFLHAMS